MSTSSSYTYIPESTVYVITSYPKDTASIGDRRAWVYKFDME